MSSKKKSSSSSSRTPSVPLNDSMSDCLSLLRSLKEKPEAEPFLSPVDWEAYGLNDYPEIIKNPMDLGTVESKLLDGKYKDISSFAGDTRLVFDNCMRYNRPDSDLYATSEKLLKLFDKKFQKMKSGNKKGKDGESAGASRADRLKFSQIVNQLTPEQLGTLVEMIQKDCPAALNEEDDDEIEIEINQLDSNILGALILFAQNCITGVGGNAGSQQKIKK